ncbi:MAG: Hsp20/alpha crystallin family protein [Halanaeroarchaeum sp.]
MSGLSDSLRSLPEAVFVDGLESEDAYRLVFDLPGVRAAGLDLTAAGNRIRIEAQRSKAVEEKYWFREENRDIFLDVDVPLPPDAETAGTEATLDAGVLQVTIPKRSKKTITVPVEG